MTVETAGWPKNWHIIIRLILASSRNDRFSNQEKNGSNTITKDPTTPQKCRYTPLWNVSVLKATTENKTTAVTTHFKSASSSSKSVHCMRCRKVRSLAMIHEMSWRAEPSDSQMMVSSRLKNLASDVLGTDSIAAYLTCLKVLTKSLILGLRTECDRNFAVKWSENERLQNSAFFRTAASAVIGQV